MASAPTASASQVPLRPAEQHKQRRTTMGYMTPHELTRPKHEPSTLPQLASGSHKCHPKSKPTANEFLQQRWDYLKYEDHRHKVPCHSGFLSPACRGICEARVMAWLRVVFSSG